MEKRQHKLTTWQSENNIDMCFIQSKENIFYLSNVYSDPHERLTGLFFFKNTEPIFICPKMEVEQVKDAGWENEIIGYGDEQNPWELIQKHIATNQKVDKIEKIAIEKEVTTYSRYESLLQISSAHCEIVEVDQLMNELRVIKDEHEIYIMQHAAELADYGVEVGISCLREGITEMEVLAKIEYELKKKGIREMSFSTMVLFGENSGQPHGNPGLRKLKKGDFVLFDLGVIVDGYCSDITRTVVYKSYTEKQKEIYDIVLKAQMAALSNSQPGTRIGDLDIIARQIITEAGFGNYYPHRLGHGLGINVHEFPSMNENNNHTLKKGMVYTIEPGVYLPDIGGVRIEDDVLITDEGYRTLTQFTKEFTVIS
ncbi:M24 family metallopeptidase [Metabacillus malikii]|uniref:Xaa-Pro dipeptidase n=1 Tax=Metabacillus malikii TaxID=1504265 RepID=A0ABT9ZB55_9BACI|nr:Xaa-Pro peptidase family protein [Metabacillus malikii]MDQ0229498.1 Xaa-Pro dipeptidase [Metabacillus malikii]